jgi:hypothetical protein
MIGRGEYVPMTMSDLVQSVGNPPAWVLGTIEVLHRWHLPIGCGGGHLELREIGCDRHIRAGYQPMIGLVVIAPIEGTLYADLNQLQRATHDGGSWGETPNYFG